MTALLTDNLPLLAGAPNGIKKLRELILELAVRGKLVPQDSNDEPASAVLRRIGEAKTRLLATGKIKKKSLPDMAGEELPFQLPTGWEWCKLSGLLPDFQNGASSRGDANGINVTVLRLADIKLGEVSLEDTRSLTLEAATISKHSLEAGDILLIRVNGSADLVGRFIVCRSELQAIPCDHFIRMRLPKGVIDSTYLKIVSDSAQVRRAIAGLFVSTAGQKTVNQGHIGSLPIPLPPLAEQHRIVAKVDELMALCDRLEARQADAESAHAQLVQALLDSLTQATDAADFAANWQRLTEHFHTLFTTESSIDTLKQTLLQLAVMGKLVPQDPSDEPASELLKRIAEEKARLVAEGKIKKQKAMPDVSEEEMPFELPQGWSWCRLQDAFDVRDGTHDTPKYQQSGYPLVTSKNLYTGKLDLTDVKCISEEDHQKISARSKVDRGDILFAMIGSIGNPVIVDTDVPFSIKNVALLKQYAPALMSADFLLLYLLVAAADMREKSAGGVQSFVSLSSIRLYPFSSPALSEQHRIVAKIDQLMALCDQLKSRLNQARQVHEHLANALVEQAVT